MVLHRHEQLDKRQGQSAHLGLQVGVCLVAGQFKGGSLDTVGLEGEVAVAFSREDLV